MQRTPALLLAATLIAGCSGTAAPVAVTTVPSQDPAVATVEPETSAEPSADVATVEPESEEPSAAVEAEANVVLVRTVYKPYSSEYGGGGAQLISVVRNDGTAPAKLSGMGYTLYDKSGDVAETGDMSPLVQFLAPGETGYLGGWASFDSAKDRKSIGKAVADDPEFETADAIPPCASLKVARVRAKPGDYGVWATVSGVVTNDCGEELSMGSIGAVMLDGDGKPLGWVSDSTSISDLKDGKSKGFKTDYGFAKASILKNVKKVLVFAYDYEF